MNHPTRTLLAGIAALTLPLGLIACGSDDNADEPSDTTMTTEAGGDSDSDMNSNMGSGGDMAGADETFGPGCAEVPEDGDGSFAGMAQDPVATAASNNPLLTTLVTAVGEADLVDTLNGAEDITVFAPIDDAFTALDPETLDAAMDDPDGLLTTVLQHHVIGERLSPDDLAGSHETLAGDMVTVEGSGEDFTVDGSAAVICGNVQTANATVYIVDGVLLPE